MPRLDELLGLATVATAGLVLAIALRFVANDAPTGTNSRVDAFVAEAASSTGATVVVLPSIEVIGHRRIEMACGVPEEKLAREC